MENPEFETLLKFYESARQEILVRITARDNTLLIYLGAVGAIIAASFQTNETIFLLIIPFISLGISFIVSNHHAVISALAMYCSTELGKIFFDNNINIPQWDNSRTRLTYSGKTTATRYLGDIIIINVPCTLAIIVTAFDFKLHSKALPIYLFAWVCFIISTLIIILTFVNRSRMFKKRKFITSF